mmetsp:Transcript_74396/g.201224  ORF Transcript_74396/g.201224 Transcript_74396/m.201224 type:complete len:293 (-) Transcript_74396:1116-1994(-)
MRGHDYDTAPERSVSHTRIRYRLSNEIVGWKSSEHAVALEARCVRNRETNLEQTWGRGGSLCRQSPARLAALGAGPSGRRVVAHALIAGEEALRVVLLLQRKQLLIVAAPVPLGPVLLHVAALVGVGTRVRSEYGREIRAYLLPVLPALLVNGGAAAWRRCPEAAGQLNSTQGINDVRMNLRAVGAVLHARPGVPQRVVQRDRQEAVPVRGAQRCSQVRHGVCERLIPALAQVLLAEVSCDGLGEVGARPVLGPGWHPPIRAIRAKERVRWLPRVRGIPEVALCSRQRGDHI